MTDHASNPSNADPLAEIAQDETRYYNQGLTPLHPPHKKLIRIHMAIRGLVLLIGATGAGILLEDQIGFPAKTMIAPTILIAALLVFALPNRIYRRWGYDMGDEQLRVLRGFLWRTDTIVPFNRIQHIDVAQGPFQRLFDLSTLIVHTAGTHNSIVTLPGLHTPVAEEMRDTIKGHIRQDMI